MPRKSKAARDNRANQLNPNHPPTKDNRADQLNPNNAAYWQARGFFKTGYVKRLLDRQARLKG